MLGKVCVKSNVLSPAEFVNASGFAHGSIAYSLLDTACAYALGSQECRGVTVHGDVNYVLGAKQGSQLLSRVVIASRSRRVASLTGEVFLLDGQEQKLAAHGSFIFQLRVE